MTRLRKLGTLMIIASLLLILLCAGCGPKDDVPAKATNTSEETSKPLAYDGTPYLGLVSMEELVLHSSAIARVRFRSVEQGVEQLRWVLADGAHLEYYAGALVITFDVLEYLKGNGGQQVEVVLYDRDGLQRTRAEVEALNEDLLKFRDKRWDDREAIVFLHSGQPILSTENDSDRYYMGYLRAQGELAYTVDSRWAKAWLPDAAAPSANGRASGSSGDAQHFFTKVSSGGGATRQAGNQTETMTLGEIKAFITALEAEVDAGDDTEDYRECVQRKYSWPDEVADYKSWVREQGWDYNKQFNRAIESGGPAGTEVYEGGDYVIVEGESRTTEPTYADDVVVISGQDADLFGHRWPLIATTARPLPEGEYRFYWAEQSPIESLCDAMPEDHRTRNEVVVTVTAPEGTLHEAFFDAVSIASGVGADSSNGVLNPASFTVDGTSTSITGLKWDSGSVVLSLSPYASLSGHKLDFIELDGSVSLSLPASSATEDTTAGTLTWSVPTQPWHNADLLMLRISTLTVTPDPTPVPTAEPTPIPTAGITVTLSPRTVYSLTFADLSIQWNDPASCDSRYIVGIYDSIGNTSIHSYGFYPAPATTSLEMETSWLLDSIADRDWLVRVLCAPSGGDWTLVGEAELRSGLP